MKKLLFLLAFLPSFAFSSGIYNPGGSTDLLPGDTNYIWNTSTLQSGATFYVSSGTVNGMLTLIPTASQTDNILDVKNTSNKTVGGYFSNGVGIIPSTGTAGTYYDHNLWFKTDGTDPGNSYLYIERNQTSSNWGYGAGIFLKDASAAPNFDVRGGMRIRSNAAIQYYDTLEFLAPIYAVGPTVVYSCPPTGGNNYYNGSVFQIDPTVLRVPNQDLIPNGNLPLTSGFRIEGLGLGGGSQVLVDEIASIYVTSSPYIINNNGGFSRIGRSYDMLLVSQATWTYNMGLRTYTDQVGDAIRVDHSSSAAALFSVGPEGQLYTSSTFTVAKATVVINGTTNYWPSANASGVLTNNGSGTLSWSAASGGGASSLAVAEDGVQKTSPTVGIDFGYGMNVGVVGSTAIVSLANQATGYVWADATSLQTGATFYVSSGTVQTFNVNTNGSGATANINGTFTVDRPDLGTGVVNRAQMFFDPNTSATKLQFRTYNPIGPDPQIAWYDNSGNNYAYISVPPSPTNMSMRVSSGTGITPAVRWSIGGNSSQGFYGQNQLEVFRVDIGSASLRYGNQLQFNDDGNSFYTSFRSTPTGTYNQNYTLPDSTGAVDQVLAIKTSYPDHVDTYWKTVTAGSGDNLGNHLATTTLSMRGFSLTNIGTSSSVFGTNGNLTVNSSSTFNSTSTWVGASTTTYGSGTSLDMSSARLTIPYGTAPTATGTGQIAYDTTDGDLIIATGATQRVYATALTPFHVTISSWTDGWSNHTVNVFQAPLDKGITIATITACTSVVASTVTFQLEERGRNTPNTAGTDVFTVAQATANGTCAEYFGSSFTNPTMAAGTHIIFDTDSSASSGTTADEVSITVWYWKDVE